jgi:Skp family chaperone for outer membrane proteins
MFTAIILLIIGSVLIFLNIRAINKEKNSFQGILGETSDNMKEFEVEIGKLRREFAETLLELQTEISNLEKKLEDNSSANNNTHIEENNEINKKSVDKKLSMIKILIKITIRKL